MALGVERVGEGAKDVLMGGRDVVWSSQRAGEGITAGDTQSRMIRSAVRSSLIGAYSLAEVGLSRTNLLISAGKHYLGPHSRLPTASRRINQLDARQHLPPLETRLREI